MPYYSLGNQGFYNAFANAGNGIRGTMGEIMGMYDKYKPNGLEDQRRVELAMQQQRTASDIALQGAQTTGMTAEQQRAQDLFNYQKQFRPNPNQPDAANFQPGGAPSAPAGGASNSDGQLPSVPTVSAAALGGQPGPPPASGGYNGSQDQTPYSTGKVEDGPGALTAPIQPGTGTPDQPAPGGGTSSPESSPGPMSIGSDGTVTAHPSPAHGRAAPGAGNQEAAALTAPPGQPPVPNLPPISVNGQLPGPPPSGGTNMGPMAPPTNRTLPTPEPGSRPLPSLPPAPAAPPAPPEPGYWNYPTTQAAVTNNEPRAEVIAKAAGDTARNALLAGPHMLYDAGKWLSAPFSPTASPGAAPAPAGATPAVSTPPPITPSAPATPPQTPAAAAVSQASAPPSLGGQPAPPVAPSLTTPGTVTIDPQAAQSPMLFQELPPQTQQQFAAAWRQHQPGATLQDAATAFNDQVRAETGTMRRPAAEQDLMSAIRLGIDPSTFIHQGVLDPLAEARALVPAYQKMMGPSSGGLWRYNPGTGQIEATPDGLQPSPIDPHMNRLDQATVEKVRYEFNQNGAVKDYNATAVPYASLKNLCVLPKTTNNQDNDIISMAARVINPGGVVRPTSVEFEQSHPGLMTEVSRAIKGWTSGGKLSDSERAKILEASTATYQGLYDQYAQQRQVAMSQAQFAIDQGVDPQRLEGFMLGTPLTNLSADVGQSQGKTGAAPAGVQTVANPAQAKALPVGTVFIYKGQQYTRK